MSNVAIEGNFYTTPIPDIAASTVDSTASDVVPVPRGATFCKVAGRCTVPTVDADADAAFTILKKMRGQTVFSSIDNGAVHRTGQGASTANGIPSNIDCDQVEELQVAQVQNTNGADEITTVSLPFTFIFLPDATQ